MTVCFKIDNFLTDQDKTGWFVDLSDGTRVFSDDNRPELEEKNSWKRLRTYLYENNLYIKTIFIRFRSEVRTIGSSDEGYFFRKGLMADIASGKNYGRFIFGLIKDGKIHTKTYSTPELQYFESEDEIRELEGHEESVIWNSKVKVEKSVPHLNTSPS